MSITIEELEANNNRLSEGWKRSIDEALDLRMKIVELNDDVRLANERSELFKKMLKVFCEVETDHDYMKRAMAAEGIAADVYDDMRKAVK